MSDNIQGFILDPKNMEEAHHNAQFQLDNVSGWLDVKKYECALIYAECLVDALKVAISLEKENNK